MSTNILSKLYLQLQGNQACKGHSEKLWNCRSYKVKSCFTKNVQAYVFCVLGMNEGISTRTVDATG